MVAGPLLRHRQQPTTPITQISIVLRPPRPDHDAVAVVGIAPGLRAQPAIVEPSVALLRANINHLPNRVPNGLVVPLPALPPDLDAVVEHHRANVPTLSSAVAAASIVTAGKLDSDRGIARPLKAQ
jgi:hypothetical protein